MQPQQNPKPKPKPKLKFGSIHNLERVVPQSSSKATNNENANNGDTNNMCGGGADDFHGQLDVTALEVRTLTPTTSGNFTCSLAPSPAYQNQPSTSTTQSNLQNNNNIQNGNHNNNNSHHNQLPSRNNHHHHQHTSSSASQLSHVKDEDWIVGRTHQLKPHIFRVNGDQTNTYHVVKRIENEHRAQRELEHYNTKSRHPGVISYQKFAWLDKDSKHKGAEVTMEYINRGTLTTVEKELANMLALRIVVDSLKRKTAEEQQQQQSSESTNQQQPQQQVPQDGNGDRNTNNNNNIIANNNGLDEAASNLSVGSASSSSSSFSASSSSFSSFSARRRDDNPSTPVSAHSSDRKYREQLAKSVARQVFDALLYYRAVHDRWHRDIKPDNILCRNDGCIKLADFDVSREADCSMTVAASNSKTSSSSSMLGATGSGRDAAQHFIGGGGSGGDGGGAGGVTHVGTPDYICVDYGQYYKREAKKFEKKIKAQQHHKAMKEAAAVAASSASAVQSSESKNNKNNGHTNDAVSESESESTQNETEEDNNEEEFQLDPGKADVYSVGCVLFQILYHLDFERNNSVANPNGTGSQLAHQLDLLDNNTNRSNNSNNNADFEFDQFSLGRPPFPGRDILFNCPSEQEVTNLEETYFNPQSEKCIVHDPVLRALLRRCLVYNPNHRASLAEASALTQFFDFPASPSSSSSSSSQQQQLPKPSRVLAGCVGICDHDLEETRRHCKETLFSSTSEPQGDSTSPTSSSSSSCPFDLYSKISDYSSKLLTWLPPSTKRCHPYDALKLLNIKRKPPLPPTVLDDAVSKNEEASVEFTEDQEKFIFFAEKVKFLMKSITSELTAVKKCLEAKHLKDLPCEALHKTASAAEQQYLLLLQRQQQQQLQKQQDGVNQNIMASQPPVTISNHLNPLADEQEEIENGEPQSQRAIIEAGMLKTSTSIDDVTTVRHQLKQKQEQRKKQQQQQQNHQQVGSEARREETDNNYYSCTSTSSVSRSNIDQLQPTALGGQSAIRITTTTTATTTNAAVFLHNHNTNNDTSASNPNTPATPPNQTFSACDDVANDDEDDRNSSSAVASNVSSPSSTVKPQLTQQQHDNIIRHNDSTGRSFVGTQNDTNSKLFDDSVSSLSLTPSNDGFHAASSTQDLLALTGNKNTLNNNNTNNGFNNFSFTSASSQQNQKQQQQPESSPPSSPFSSSVVSKKNTSSASSTYNHEHNSAVIQASSFVISVLHNINFSNAETPLSRMTEKERKEAQKKLKEVGEALDVPPKHLEKMFQTAVKTEPKATQETVLLKSIRNTIADEMKKRWSTRAEPAHFCFKTILKEVDKFKQLFLQNQQG